MHTSASSPHKAGLSLTAVLLAIFCNVLWGSAYPAIKIGYTLFQIDNQLFYKILFAGIRFFCAGLLVLCLTAVGQRKIPVVRKGSRHLVLLMAIIYTTLQYLFFYIGLSHTTGSNGSIFNSTTTFMSVILAHFLYADEKLTFQKIGGCLLGFLGVLFVTFRNQNAGFSFFGEGFILIAAACFVIGSAMSKKAVQNNDSATVTGYNLLLGGGMLILIGLLGGGRLPVITPAGILVLGYLILLSTVAFTVWTALLQNNPLGSLSVFNFIIPVSGTLLSAIFLRENIWHWQYPVSLLLVCIGIFMVNFGKNGLNRV